MAEIIPDSASIIILQTQDGFITEVHRTKDRGVDIILKKQKAQNPLIRLSIDGYRELCQAAESIESAVYYLQRQEDEIKRRQLLKERFDKKANQSAGNEASETKSENTFYGGGGY